MSIEEFIKILDEYLYLYNETRIKISLGALIPVEYRKKPQFSSLAVQINIHTPFTYYSGYYERFTNYARHYSEK
ncbi:MAG: IS3 family transposase [Synergistales bacterium]|nr:IS3 family transposase [Synergistales bacterium]